MLAGKLRIALLSLASGLTQRRVLHRDRVIIIPPLFLSRQLAASDVHLHGEMLLEECSRLGLLEIQPLK